jgi:putative two-component system response regulator
LYKASIIVVDDSIENLEVISQILELEGYEVRPFKSGLEAFEAAVLEPPDLFILDILMPEIDGLELCKKIKETDKLAEIPVIFLSALGREEDIKAGFLAGGVDYATKPLKKEEIISRVKTHIKLHDTLKELTENRNNLQAMVEKKVKELLRSQYATIFSLSKLAEYRDDDTGTHLERVRHYCRTLAMALMEKRKDLDEEFVETIFYSSPLHDIGKVAIPDNILLKPGRLTRDEFEIMKQHTIYGANALKEVLDFYPDNRFVRIGLEIARWHHERWDGTGYPDGLKGDEIPLSAQIMAVADVYDALRSKRPYKAPMDHTSTVKIILEAEGRQFSPEIVAAFRSIMTKFSRIYDYGEADEQ